MESQKIKEERRKKFLEKMENKRKGNKKDLNNNNNIIKQQNQVNNESANKSINTQPLFSNMAQNQNNNLNQIKNLLNQTKQNDLLNNIINKQSSQEIDFKNIIEQTNGYDYIINFQKIIKKILIIILSIIHCFAYSPLDNIFVFKYTFIILELSSFFFNKYYYSKKAELRKKIMNSGNNNVNTKINSVEQIIQFLLNNFGFLNQLFVFFKAIKDTFLDISILFIINVIFLLFKEKD